VSLQAFFASCPRGLESLLAEELGPLGAKKPEPVSGGVAFEGDMRACYRANLESRLATRVLMRLARSPYRGEEDVYEAALAVKWSEWFSETQSIRVDVNAIRSPLKSLEFATLRIKDAVCDVMRDMAGARPSVDTRFPDLAIMYHHQIKAWTAAGYRVIAPDCLGYGGTVHIPFYTVNFCSACD